jgi:phosphomannomutase
MRTIKKNLENFMYKIVNNINPHIFRGYDIRGVMDKDLNEDVYYTTDGSNPTKSSKKYNGGIERK